MVRLKYIGGVFVALVLCGMIWFAYSLKERVNQMENQISSQYLYANFLLRDTVEDLLAWNFSQPLTEADEEYLTELFTELRFTTDLIFSGNVVHREWRSRMGDIEDYLWNYANTTSLSEEDIADLNQALQATRFITMDFGEVRYNFYDAMHDEQHEMVERIRSRLATKY